jgi:hypothetical protein
MAAEDNLSHQLFFEAHRGVKLHSGNNFQIDKNNLGMHWSADEEVAKDFGGVNSMVDATRVIHAKIPMSSVETSTERMKQRDVHMDPKSPEKEIPVKENAPVLVTGVSRYKEVYGPVRYLPSQRVKTKSRTRTYNPPREMKA